MKDFKFLRTISSVLFFSFIFFRIFSPGSVCASEKIRIKRVARLQRADTLPSGQKSIFLNNETILIDPVLIYSEGTRLTVVNPYGKQTIPTMEIDRIEYGSYFFRFDTLGKPVKIPYDILIGKSGDTTQGIIYQVTPNFISCHIKGKTKKGFIPQSAIKNYQWSSKDYPFLIVVKDNTPPADTTGNAVRIWGAEKQGAGTQPPIWGAGEQGTGGQPDSSRAATSISVQSVPDVDSTKTSSPSVIKITGSLPSDDLYDCNYSYIQGRKDAYSESSAMLWGVGGCASTCIALNWVLPIIGANMNYVPDHYPPDVNKDCYKIGYNERKKYDHVIYSSIGAGTMVVSVVSFLLLLYDMPK